MTVVNYDAEYRWSGDETENATTSEIPLQSATGEDKIVTRKSQTKVIKTLKRDYEQSTHTKSTTV